MTSKVNKHYTPFDMGINNPPMISLHLFTLLCFAFYLLSCGSHVDHVLNAVVKEVPSVLEVWRGILKHHQLCGVIDSCQRCPFGVPVHLNLSKKEGHRESSNQGLLMLVKLIAPCIKTHASNLHRTTENNKTAKIREKKKIKIFFLYQ